MKTQNSSTRRALLGVLLAASITTVPPVYSEDGCTDCESTRWESESWEFLEEGQYGLSGETTVCALAEIFAWLDALANGAWHCAATSNHPGGSCASRSDSCPPGSHCELGFSLGEMVTTSSTLRGFLDRPFEWCDARQIIHCFCHCVPDDDAEIPESDGDPDAQDIATPAPTTTPTPAQRPTPQPSHIA